MNRNRQRMRHLQAGRENRRHVQTQSSAFLPLDRIGRKAWVGAYDVKQSVFGRCRSAYRSRRSSARATARRARRRAAHR